MAYQPFGSTSSGSEGDGGNAGDGGGVPGFLDPGSNGSGDRDGSRDAAGNDFDPDIHSGRDKLNADGTFRKKRGRRAGSGNTATGGSRTKADHKASIEGLTRVLAIMHIGIATATRTPEMALQADEAELLAASTANVLEHFDIRPDPKLEAIVGLMTTAGMIYGPRIILIKQRKQRERKEEE